MELRRHEGGVLCVLVAFLFSDDSSGSTDAVDLEEKHKVPHSYSRAEENARFLDGARDDEIAL